MASTPIPKSFEEMYGDLLRSYMSAIGVNDLNTGSVITSYFEAVAQLNYRTQGSIFQILRDYSVDRAVGEALRRIAEEEYVTPLSATPATGNVTISDASFEKTATRIYPGTPPPNIGENIIYVSDATGFDRTNSADFDDLDAGGTIVGRTVNESIYIGRGTNNIEGPLGINHIVKVGSYYKITLNSPTTKFHNLFEFVTLAQGGTRTVPAGTVVKSPASGASPDILYTTVNNIILLDGENQVSNVQITAQQVGETGNVPRGAITAFTASPFTNATVINEQPLTTGRDEEDDDDLRDRIKAARFSRGLGTELAVKSATLGAQAYDESAIITSNEIVTVDEQTTLYIDDGQGYEEKSNGVGVEYIVDSALGGEYYFDLATGGRQTSVVKAYLESINVGPYKINEGDKLAILVGGMLSEHRFEDTDFKTPNSVTAYEVVASINANSDLLFEAATSNAGTTVRIRAKAETREYLQVTDPTDLGTNDNVAKILNLPTNEVHTLTLYKNRELLLKDGRIAYIDGADQSDWSLISDGVKLAINVDNTEIHVYTFNDLDFIDEGTHFSVSKDNTLESWVNVINSKVTGITASIAGTKIRLESNLGADSRASIELFLLNELDPIESGYGLVEVGMFELDNRKATGADPDYELSRNTAQIKLNEPLDPGDKLQAGLSDTKGQLASDSIGVSTITFADDAILWIVADEKAEMINTAVAANTNIQVDTTAVAGSIRFASNQDNSFVNVEVGDYVVIWGDEFDANNRGEYRVQNITDVQFVAGVTLENNAIDVIPTAAESAAAVDETIIYKEGFHIVRTNYPVQKVTIQAAQLDIYDIADLLTELLDGIEAFVINGEQIILRSLTQATTGAVLIVTVNDSAKALNFTTGVRNDSLQSHYAFVSSEREGWIPKFVHGTNVTAKEEFITSIDTAFGDGYVLTNDNQNDLLCPLHPYTTEKDNTSSINKCWQVENINGIEALLDSNYGAAAGDNNTILNRMRTTDRFVLMNPYDFSWNDTLVVILDNDPVNKTFLIDLFRELTTSSNPNFVGDTLNFDVNDLNVLDVTTGQTGDRLSHFEDFDFSNFKAMMQARNVIDYGGTEDAIIFRSAVWGKGGEYYRVSYEYPTQSDQEVSHTIVATDNIHVKIRLKSGIAKTTSSDNTTEWTATVTAGVPDVVQFDHTGGTAPNLTAAGIAPGDIVYIGTNTGFADTHKGAFKIIASSDTSFTVNMLSGNGVNGDVGLAGVGTTTSEVKFFVLENTTAQEIADYTNTILVDYLSAELLNDGGLNGGGVIDESYLEFTGFTDEYIQLVDGENQIEESRLDIGNINTVGGSINAMFTFKNPLVFPGVVGDPYVFQDGSEKVRVVPTTADQVQRFLSVLAQTGLTTLGTINTADFSSRIEIGTQTFGSSGSVEVAGGSATSATTNLVLPSVEYYDSDNHIHYMNSYIARTAQQGFHAGQWLRFQATTTQKKDTGIDENTAVQIRDGGAFDNDNLTSSIITLVNRQNDQLFFGEPRPNVRDRGRRFFVEKHGALVCISWDNATGGDPEFKKTVNINLQGTATTIDVVTSSDRTTYTITAGDWNFSEVTIGDIVDITGGVAADNQGEYHVIGISEAYDSIELDNITGTDETGVVVADGDFTFTSEIKEGDTVRIGGPDPETNGTCSIAGNTTQTACESNNGVWTASPAFAILNQGIFKVIRRFDNSIYIENDNAIEEDVIVSDDLRTMGGDATTQYSIIQGPNNRMRLAYSSGTAPDFSIAELGDVATISGAGNAANNGDFMVSGYGESQAQVSYIVIPEASAITNDSRFLIYSAGNVNSYEVIFSKDGGATTGPAAGFTAAIINITTGEDAATVAASTMAIINALNTSMDFTTSFDSTDNILQINTQGTDITNSISTPDTGIFDVSTFQSGASTYLELVNASFVVGDTITDSANISVHQPALLFTPYEATRPDDIFSITDNVLGENNRGHREVLRVLDRYTIQVAGAMDIVGEQSLGNSGLNVYITESEPYYGYKQIYTTYADPTNDNQAIILFNSAENVSKINSAAGTSISTVGNLNYDSEVVKGLNSYRYHTGLIAEANRIVYGDPRDNISYPGVAAAGAEIFIKPPLVRRIELSISVRVKTGVSFPIIIEQVRTNVAALINSNPVGNSIAISNIVSAVDEIPGVRAVAIDSPQYDPTNDMIQVNPSEKSLILDVEDIIVQQID